VLLEGSVTDQSPAQMGTPCVSKDSMALQMDYLHMQTPIDGVWHNQTISGVPVSLDTVDPNGNPIHIADVTTDGYSGTFGYTWHPQNPGQYKVTATFTGDESYGSSFATTYVSMNEPTAASPTPSTTTFANAATTTDLMTYIVAATIAIIISIAIVGVLILRKYP
jgi:hypothetical protein